MCGHGPYICSHCDFAQMPDLHVLEMEEPQSSPVLPPHSAHGKWRQVREAGGSVTQAQRDQRIAPEAHCIVPPATHHVLSCVIYKGQTLLYSEEGKKKA